MAAAPVVWLGLLLLGLSRSSAFPGWRTVVLIAVVSPILEEIVFRGGLQFWLVQKAPFARRIVFGITLANVCVSALFALFHLFNQAPIWAAAVFVPSLVFGWAMDRYKSVLPCIALHMLYNLGFVLLFV